MTLIALDLTGGHFAMNIFGEPLIRNQIFESMLVFCPKWKQCQQVKFPDKKERVHL